MNFQQFGYILEEFSLEKIKNSVSSFSPKVLINDVDDEHYKSRYFEIGIKGPEDIAFILDITIGKDSRNNDSPFLHLNLFTSKDRTVIQEYDMLYMLPYLSDLKELQKCLEEITFSLKGSLKQEDAHVEIRNVVMEKLNKLESATKEDIEKAAQFVNVFEIHHKPFIRQRFEEMVVTKEIEVQNTRSALHADIDELVVENRIVYLKTEIDRALDERNHQLFMELSGKLIEVQQLVKNK